MENAINNAPTFKTVNPHSEKFSDFGNKRLFDRLQEKFTPKPYHYQYRVLRVVVLASSYLFHVLSAATAFFLIYTFIGKLIPSTLVAGAITVAALCALELSKRETSGRLFNDFLQFGKLSATLLLVVIGLAGISTACSYFGAQRVVLELTPAPVLVNPDSVTAPLRTQLASIDHQVADARKTKWNGTTTTRSQRTIERLTRQRETILAELVRVQQRTDSRNDATEQRHTSTTEINASTFAAFTATCELLLVLCLFYLAYYDFRSFAEYAKGIEGKRPAQVGFNTAASFVPSSNGNGHATSSSAERRPIGYAYANRDARAQTQNVITENVDHLRTCGNCGTQYVYGHARQRYCSDACRIDAWQKKTGKMLRKRNADVTQ